MGIGTETIEVGKALGRGDPKEAGRHSVDLVSNVAETALVVLPLAKGVQGLKAARAAKVTEAAAGTTKAAKAGAATTTKTAAATDAAASTSKTVEAGAKGAKGSVQEVLEGAGADVRPYKPTKPVIPQETPNTCVAASCRTIAADAGLAVSEESLTAALQTTEHGANVLKAGGVLDEIGIKGGVATPNATLAALEEGLSGGRSAVIGLEVPGLGRHAVVLDRISEGRAFIRDPLPVNVGSSFSVSVQDFQFIFRGRAVTFK